MTRQISKSMAHLLAASGCDLGDEREVIRVLRRAGNREGDIIGLADTAVELARELRARMPAHPDDTDTPIWSNNPYGSSL